VMTRVLTCWLETAGEPFPSLWIFCFSISLAVYVNMTPVGPWLRSDLVHAPRGP
jgi:hypothetical protein